MTPAIATAPSNVVIQLPQPPASRRTAAQQRNAFYSAIAAELTAEDWRQMDREDVEALAIAGDE